jgi:hypothetical protein
MADEPETTDYTHAQAEPLRWVTCVSCGQTFAAREYPPTQCTACGIHFSHKALTVAGDTLDKVQKREARKALRKGMRK